MASNYDSISKDNKERYGWDIERIGKMLLTDRYDDRTHFIYELLQNAEDALARHTDSRKNRSVEFRLSDDHLVFSHHGEPFNERDVRGICGIAESTKSLTAIGRFGIGFKSVYAFTAHPEIHSGDECFMVESYVKPKAIAKRDRVDGETLIHLPFDLEDRGSAVSEIQNSLRKLGPESLLFLKQIESIEWKENNAPTGQYVREVRILEGGTKRIDLLGKIEGQEEQFLSYLVFSDDACDETGKKVGEVEIAFRIGDEKGKPRVQAISRSPLVVFFPTALETDLGFLFQGPFRTTPSRDNVPRDDPWNLKLIELTGALLRRSLTWLRDHDLLDTHVLECLPINTHKFSDDHIFASLYEATRVTLLEESLIPCETLGYLPATQVRIGRTKEIRSILSPEQLQQLEGNPDQIDWIRGEITRDRAGLLREYLMKELGAKEYTPPAIIRLITGDFLKSQPADWLGQFYLFLDSNSSLRSSWEDLPLVRLRNGDQVTATDGDRVLAYLPSELETTYPEVEPTTITCNEITTFLQELGVKKPELVDEVIEHVLPRYREEEINIEAEDYAQDISKIIRASESDSTAQRMRLISALKETEFVMAVDAASADEYHVFPGGAYFPTETLAGLLGGIEGAMLIDKDQYPCLKREGARDLLETCGVADQLRPIKYNPEGAEIIAIRRKAGTESTRSSETFSDYDLEFLEAILEKIPTLEKDSQSKVAGHLWQTLAKLEREKRNIFTARYHGQYYGYKSINYLPKFIKRLRKSAWIPDISDDGKLKKPELIEFSNTNFKPNPNLEKKIGFKPPIIEQLAREVGIDPKMLDLLKEVGITNEEELRERLRLSESESEQENEGTETDSESTEPEGVNERENRPENIAGGATSNNGGSSPSPRSSSYSSGERGATQQGSTSGHAQPRPPQGQQFISYVGLHPDNEAERNGMTQEARMAVEESAIEKIIESEPRLQRTPPNNAGFDLFEADGSGEAIKWVEIKAMTGSLDNHPVAISKTQYEFAMDKREKYWLYVYEHVNSEDAKLTKINDPYGKSMSFTFDHGWRNVGEDNND